ncbi:RluA family pseudouridine synthase [Corynebacterium halotolerans]|uniref:RluA family pseudouridine synthase n=1 Tax=Corynebacterium halotolerans TaxID=225326 RepID=UPI003CE70E1C
MNNDHQPPRDHQPALAREIEVSGEHEGRRLDKYLRAELKGVPASLLFRLLRKGKVRVNDRRAQPNYRLEAGDVLRLPPMQVQADLPPPTLSRSLLQRIDQSVVHEDERLLIINKPADVAVHVGTGVSGGVIEALRQLRPELPDLELVHRLDRDTSGLLIVAKTPSILRHLQQLLREEGSLDRRYLALVHGSWPDRLRHVDAALQRTDTGVRVGPDGQDSLTRFSVRRRIGEDATLVQAQLVTGRKHQIRVHAQYSGHPIAGDPKYGDERFNQQLQRLGAPQMFLHASELRIPLPEGDTLKVTAPMPPAWDRVLHRLKTGGSRDRNPDGDKSRGRNKNQNQSKDNQLNGRKPRGARPARPKATTPGNARRDRNSGSGDSSSRASRGSTPHNGHPARDARGGNSPRGGDRRNVESQRPRRPRRRR